jgi:hypothetical protein
MALCVATAAHTLAANAEGLGHHDDDWQGRRLELNVGAQAFRHAWSLYSGVTAAPMGGLGEDGLRVRAVGGYGAYSYGGRRATGAGSRFAEFDGETAFAELLVGYQKQIGSLTLKGFAGPMAAGHRISPDDPETTVRGNGAGAKLAAETWWTISEKAWASVDLSWGTLHGTYAGRTRLGWRLVPVLSVGIEAGAAGNIECDIARVGGFLRYEWAAGEISATAGWSNDKLLDGTPAAGLAAASTPYATLSWLTKF